MRFWCCDLLKSIRFQCPVGSQQTDCVCNSFYMVDMRKAIDDGLPPSMDDGMYAAVSAALNDSLRKNVVCADATTTNIAVVEFIKFNKIV